MDHMLEMYEWLTAWERYNNDQKRSADTTTPEKRKKVRVPKKDSRSR